MKTPSSRRFQQKASQRLRVKALPGVQATSLPTRFIWSRTLATARSVRKLHKSGSVSLWCASCAHGGLCPPLCGMGRVYQGRPWRRCPASMGRMSLLQDADSGAPVAYGTVIAKLGLPTTVSFFAIESCWYNGDERSLGP